MSDRVSPEEKLLRLIRGQKKSEPVPAKEKAPNAEPHPGQASTIPEEERKHSKHEFRLPKIEKYFNPAYYKKALVALFAISCSYFIYSLIYPLLASKKTALPQIKQEKAIEYTAPSKENYRPLEHYIEGIKGRKVFSASSAEEGESVASGVNVDAISDINLVGIIAGEDPQAAVEDKKNQKTYYVTKGQYIGDVKVEDIQEGKIILNYKGKSYELYL